jgi:hypothetical protein
LPWNRASGTWDASRRNTHSWRYPLLAVFSVREAYSPNTIGGGGDTL